MIDDHPLIPGVDHRLDDGPVAGAAAWWWRLRRAEQDIESLDKVVGPLATEVEVMRSQMTTVIDTIAKLADSVSSLRNAVLGSALTVAASAVVIALTTHA